MDNQLQVSDFIKQSRKFGNERDTHNRVLDQATIHVLAKLVNTDCVLSTIGGCISGGKEANVYYCTAPKAAVADALASKEEITSSRDATKATNGGGDAGRISTASLAGNAQEDIETDIGQEIQKQKEEEEEAVEGDHEDNDNETSTNGDPETIINSLARPITSHGGERIAVAVKIYATTTNIFKERQAYMQGWHNVSGVRSTRKMVSQWTANEYRHLRRLQAADIPAPIPIRHRENVLVMTLLTDRNGRPCPRLKDADVSWHSRANKPSRRQQTEETLAESNKVKEGNDDSGEDKCDDQDEPPSHRWTLLYMQLVGYMRRMFRISRLVHGDLSEYNVLYQEQDADASMVGNSDNLTGGRLCIIDVSQSLEHNHPQCLTKLRVDIANVSGFFRRKGVDVLRHERLFHFITTENAPLEPAAMCAALREEMAQEKNQADREALVDDDREEEERERERAHVREVADATFKEKFIPRTLDEAYELAMEGGDADLSGVRHLLANDPSAKAVTMNTIPVEGGHEGSTTSNDHDIADTGSDDNDNDGEKAYAVNHAQDNHRPRGKRFMDKDEKHQHKMAVKEEKREKRKQKIPKKVKSALVAKTARNHK